MIGDDATRTKKIKYLDEIFVKNRSVYRENAFQTTYVDIRDRKGLKPNVATEDFVQQQLDKAPSIPS